MWLRWLGAVFGLGLVVVMLVFVVLSVVLVAIVVFLYDCFGFIVIACCLCGVAPNGFCGLIRFCCFGLVVDCWCCVGVCVVW